jgi:hypothetical protein
MDNLQMIKVSEETCPLLSNGLEGGVMSGTSMDMEWWISRCKGTIGIPHMV